MPDETVEHLIAILRDDPDRRRALLHALLTEDLLALPQRVAQMDARLSAGLAELVEITRHQGEQIAELVEITRHQGEQIAELVEVTRHQGEQIAELVEVTRHQGEQIAELVEVTRHQGEQIAELVEITQRHSEELAELARDSHQHTQQLGDLRGWRVEDRFRRHGASYFSSLARRLRVLPPEELVSLVDDALDAGVLTGPERDDLLLADAVWRGRAAGEKAVYLVVEASAGIGPSDVARARRRADILGKLGAPAVAVVAGERIDPEPAEQARAARVEMVLDGRRAEVG